MTVSGSWRTRRSSERSEDRDRIAYAVSWHIGDYYHYSDRAALEGLPYLGEYDQGDIVAYLVFVEYNNVLEGVASGVFRHWRGRGLGLKIYRRMLAYARRRGMCYWTYTSWSNVESINSHLRAGMRIEKIRRDGFVNLISPGWEITRRR